MKPVYVDKTLKHQVILLYSSQEIVVSCNCLHGKTHLGRTRDFDETVRIFNEHLRPEEMAEWMMGRSSTSR